MKTLNIILFLFSCLVVVSCAQNKEQKTEKQKDDQQEMSIESGTPDIETETKDSDQDGNEIEIEEKTTPDLRKKPIKAS